MDIRVTSATRSWTVHVKVMLEVPIEGVQDEAEGVFCPTQQLEPLLRTARSIAVRHTLGILMPSRNQIRADPAGEHDDV